MTIVLMAVIFLVVAGVVAMAGVRLWAKPKEAIERVTGIVHLEEEKAPLHPSLVFHELVKKLGAMMPISPRDAGVVQKRLIRAGIRNPNAKQYLYGAKILFGVLLPILASTAVLRSESDPFHKAIIILGAGAAGFLGPNEYLNRKAKARQAEIRKGLPNALDLLVVCVESGLGLDQAMVQVAKDLEEAHPEITEEFAMVNYELKAGNRRVDSLRNLAERTNVDDLKKLVAVLIQADRFGTGVAQSLRAHAEFMRVQARQVAEEKAAKLGVKLVFPIFFCILPSLFVVTVGPMAVKIVRDLVPMMNNM